MPVYMKVVISEKHYYSISKAQNKPFNSTGLAPCDGTLAVVPKQAYANVAEWSLYVAQVGRLSLEQKWTHLLFDWSANGEGTEGDELVQHHHLFVGIHQKMDSRLHL